MRTHHFLFFLFAVLGCSGPPFKVGENVAGGQEDAAPVSEPVRRQTVVCVSPCANNLEGAWIFSSAHFGDVLINLYILQDEDRLTVLPWNASGSVREDKVTFKDDVTLFTGTVAADKKTMAGSAMDLMNDASLGAWKAER